MPCNGRLTLLLVAFGVRKSERQRKWQALPACAGAVGRYRRNADGIKASAQKDSRLTMAKATLDRPLEDVIETGCLFGRQPLQRPTDWRGIPVAIEL